MSNVTVIGMGAMGSAIAAAFLNARHVVTVWNRSKEKAEALRYSGARVANDLNEAVSASPVTVVCIDDYAALWSLLETHHLAQTLKGRTLIQFSTGTPQEARDTQAGAMKHGTGYLDGSILAYPREVGQDAIIAISGNKACFENCASLLDALSGDVRYLGEAIGAAAALDVALLSYYVCTHLGLIHAALVCESEDVRPDTLTSVIVDSLPSDAEEITHLGRALQTGDFSAPGASINVYKGVVERILTQAKDADIDARIPNFAATLYKQGIKHGLADEEVVALIKILRK